MTGWRQSIESPAGRVAELVITVGLSVYAVTLYPAEADQSMHALIQGGTVVGGLVVAALVWLIVVFVAIAPRMQNREARRELKVMQVGRPVLSIGEALPTYGYEVDSWACVLWRVTVENTTPLSVAANVEVTLHGTHHRPRAFPLLLHQQIHPRDAVTIPPLVWERRDIRHGDTCQVDLISEPRPAGPAVRITIEDFNWHSAQFNHDEAFALEPFDVALVEAEIEERGSFGFTIRVVADPPTAVAERRFELRRVRDNAEVALHDATLTQWWVEPA